MKIAINKPCHEDWEKMTPNEQGVFCQVCTKNVIDFTSKTLEEIKSFFSKPTEGGVCARFKEDQLSNLNVDSFVERFMGLKLARRVAMIVALGFIAWLSGSNELRAQDSNAKKGKVSVESGTSNRPNTNTKTGMVIATPKDTTKCTKDPKTTNNSTGTPTKKPKNKAKNTNATNTSTLKPKEEKHIMGDALPE